MVFSFDEDDNIGIVSNLGIGYYISDMLQPVVEVSYSYENPDIGESTQILNATAGFTSPVNNMLTIIFGVI